MTNNAKMIGHRFDGFVPIDSEYLLPDYSRTYWVCRVCGFRWDGCVRPSWNRKFVKRNLVVSCNEALAMDVCDY